MASSLVAKFSGGEVTGYPPEVSETIVAPGVPKFGQNLV